MLQRPEAAVIGFFRVFTEEAGGKFAAVHMISYAGAAFTVIVAGICTRALHGSVGLARHYIFLISSVYC